MTRLSESSFVMNCLTPVLHFVFMNLEATSSMVRGPDHETSKQVPLSKKKNMVPPTQCNVVGLSRQLR